MNKEEYTAGIDVLGSNKNNTSRVQLVKTLIPDEKITWIFLRYGWRNWEPATTFELYSAGKVEAKKVVLFSLNERWNV